MPVRTETSPCPRLPTPFRSLGRLLPWSLLRASVEPHLNRLFADALEDGTLQALALRELVIEVTDIGLAVGFRIQDYRLRIVRPTTSEARIKGPLAAFAWLASREADADTLFFHRHLTMEGDTELGLAVKNTVDAVDLAGLPALLRHALAGMTRLIPAQPPGGPETIPGSPYQ